MAAGQAPGRRAVWSLLRLTQNPAGLCRQWMRHPRLSHVTASPDHSFGRGMGATLISPHQMQNGGSVRGYHADSPVVRPAGRAHLWVTAQADSLYVYALPTAPETSSSAADRATRESQVRRNVPAE
jgi:hypothetical protein